MKGPKSKTYRSQPPDGKLRRSQLLFGNGPGAVLDLVDDAVMVSGLDAWRYPNDHEGFISESRLQAKVQSLLAKTGWTHSQVRLRMPPPCEDNEASPRVGIPAARFPRWFLCQNTECRSMVPFKGLSKGNTHVCRHTKGTAFPVVPIRFVSACTRGHVQDIDWRFFVHRGNRVEENGEWCHRKPGGVRPNDPLGQDWTAELYLIQTGTSGDLSDYIIGCRKCGATRGLQDLAPREALGRCPGFRPWLGYNSTESDCGEKARLLTRTASNMYFSSLVSALSIPDPAEALRDAVEQAWAFIQVATPESLPLFRQLPDAAKHLAPFGNDQIMAEIERRRTGEAPPTPPLREMEAQSLMAAKDEIIGELPRPDEKWHARRIPITEPLPFIDRVVLVKALTEVRAQVGFTRIDANVGDAEGEYELDVRTALLSQNCDWVPAVEIQGEGVYIAFNNALIDQWTMRPAVRERVRQFKDAFFEENRKNGGLGLVQFPGERLVMLHTLSHMLITSIALECGYAASSIRERLYCASVPNPQNPEGKRSDLPAELTTRAGILLYTGTPGSEGTLGGLVEVGRQIVHHLRRAVRMGMLCSNDPVCAQHNPNDGQEGRHREGAACHGCVLIGEPSCERRNLDLDRALVVPTVEEPEAAFLGDWVRSWDQQ